MKHIDLMLKYGVTSILESSIIQEEHQDDITIEGLLLEGMELEREFSNFLNTDEIDVLTEAVSIDKLILESSDLSEEELTTKIELIIEASDVTKRDKFKNFIQRMIIKLQAFFAKVFHNKDKIIAKIKKEIDTTIEKLESAGGKLTTKIPNIPGAIDSFNQMPGGVLRMISSLESIVKGKNNFKNMYKNTKNDYEKTMLVLLDGVYEDKKLVNFKTVKTMLKSMLADANKDEIITLDSKFISELKSARKDLDNEDGKKIKGKMADLVSTIKKIDQKERSKYAMGNYTQMLSVIQLLEVSNIKMAVSILKSVKRMGKAVAKIPTGGGSNGGSTGSSNYGGDFTKDKYFMSLVEKKDKISIKSSIARMLLSYRGDRSKSDKLIKYVEDKDLFTWDKHDGKDIPKQFTTVEDKYNYEKEILKRNFSKVRYERVLKLLKAFMKDRGIS